MTCLVIKLQQRRLATHTEKDTKIIRKKNEDGVGVGVEWRVEAAKISCLLISTEIICISNAIRDANKQPPNTRPDEMPPKHDRLGQKASEAMRHARSLYFLLKEQRWIEAAALGRGAVGRRDSE